MGFGDPEGVNEGAFFFGHFFELVDDFGPAASLLGLDERGEPDVVEGVEKGVEGTGLSPGPASKSVCSINSRGRTCSSGLGFSDPSSEIAA